MNTITIVPVQYDRPTPKRTPISDQELERRCNNATFEFGRDCYLHLHHITATWPAQQEHARLALLTMSCEAMIQEAA